MTDSHIPSELYREIASALYHPNHRSTLISLALVNRAWRHESQRILFKSPGDDWFQIRGMQGDIRRIAHVRFLLAIQGQPARLGAYVHSYEQHCLAVDPTLGKTIRQPSRHHIGGMYLWTLTCRSLPYFVNLKRLAFIASSVTLVHGGEASVMSLCQSQLTSLTLYGDPASEEQWAFLRGQRALLHLDSNSDLCNLPVDACPELQSIILWTAQNMNLFLQSIAHRRKIVALRLTVPNIVDDLAVLDQYRGARFEHVRYLYLSHYYPFMHAFTNVVLLVLHQWTISTIKSLCGLDELRTLALQHLYNNPDITQDEEKRELVARESRNRCPKLTHIVHILSARYRHYHYTRLTLSPRQFSTRVSEPDTPDIHMEDASEYNPDALWWNIYNVGFDT